MQDAMQRELVSLEAGDLQSIWRELEEGISKREERQDLPSNHQSKQYITCFAGELVQVHAHLVEQHEPSADGSSEEGKEDDGLEGSDKRFVR